MPDDASLLREFAESRSQSAFAELVRRHIDGIYSAALRRVGGDTHLAEDVTQHVFLALARQARSVARHPLITGWLYVATRNESANVVRAERRRKTREQQACHMEETNLPSFSEPDWSQLAPVLDQEIDRLPEHDRAAVLLRFVEHHAFAEIGRQLGVSEDAARMRVERALEKLRTGLRRRGMQSSIAALGATLTSHAVSAAPAGLSAAATTGAVAGLGAAGFTTITSAIELMLTSKSVLMGTGLILVLAAGGAGYELRARAAAESARAEARREHSATTALLAFGRQRLALLQQSSQPAASGSLSGSATSPGRGTAATDAGAATPAVTVANAEASIVRGNEFMQRHPEVRTTLIAYFDAMTDTRFGPLYREFNLSPAEIERFRLLHREYNGYGQSLEPSREMVQFRQSTGRSSDEIDRAIKELLGPDRHRRLAQYSAEAAPRNMAESLASGLTLVDPLTTGQAEQLVSFIAAAKIKRSAGVNSDFDWDRITAQAGTLLNPTQMEVLAGLRRQHDYTAALHMADKALRERENSASR